MDLSAVMNNDEEEVPSHSEDADSMATDRAGEWQTYRREYEELKKDYAAAEQDREELSARYAALTSRLDRISTENEYLLSELSYYELSDLESDQSDIEFVTARPTASPRSKPPTSRAKRTAEPAARKARPKPKQLASATAPKEEDAVSASAEPPAKRKRPTPKAKKAPAKKKPAKSDEN